MISMPRRSSTIGTDRAAVGSVGFAGHGRSCASSCCLPSRSLRWSGLSRYGSRVISRARVDDVATSGDVVAAGTLVSTAAIVGLVALLVYFRHYPIPDYLALRRPTLRSAVIALVGWWSYSSLVI